VGIFFDQIYFILKYTHLEHSISITNASAFDTTGNGGNLGLSLISGAPTGTFATLTYNSFTNVFFLSAASNLDAFFGAGAFIDAIAFNTPQPRSELNDAAVSGGGINNFVE